MNLTDVSFTYHKAHILDVHGFGEFLKNGVYDVTPVTVKARDIPLPQKPPRPLPVTPAPGHADFPSIPRQRRSPRPAHAQNQPARRPWSAFSPCSRWTDRGRGSLRFHC